MSDDPPSSDSSGGFVPETDGVSKWRNAFAALTGQMSPTALDNYRRHLEVQNEEADCKRCEKDTEFLFQYSPIIRFLTGHITKLHGDIGPHNVYCRRCTRQQTGGFSPNHGIQLCANAMRNRGHTEDTLAHEMVHAYDHLRFQVDWEDLRHAACTEIRASSLSGECRWTREFFTRAQWKLTQQHQECVRRRATLSVAARPSCKDDVQAARVVNEVWESCFADTRPFDEIYR
ncbi:MAG: Mitochondrial inner membrane protease atp23 [Piccolia ochrophora]|nr:MAG: Mitochondrial inner membrane protease atp23 [Piccolia ochrophora]